MDNALQVEIKSTLYTAEGLEFPIKTPPFFLRGDPTIVDSGRGTPPLAGEPIPLDQVTAPGFVLVRWISGIYFDVGLWIGGTFHGFSRVEPFGCVALPAFPGAVYAWKAAIDPLVNPVSAEYQLVQSA